MGHIFIFFASLWTAIVVTFTGTPVPPETLVAGPAPAETLVAGPAPAVITLPTSTPPAIRLDFVPQWSQKDPVSLPPAPIIIIMPNEKGVTETPAPAPSESAQSESAPQESSATTGNTATTTPQVARISVTNVSARPAYHDCGPAPTQTFLVRVFTSSGEEVAPVEVSYTGSATNNPSGTFTVQPGGSNFSYTVKDDDATEATLVFSSGSISVKTSFPVLPLPADKPAYCP